MSLSYVAEYKLDFSGNTMNSGIGQVENNPASWQEALN